MYTMTLNVLVIYSFYKIEWLYSIDLKQELGTQFSIYVDFHGYHCLI